MEWILLLIAILAEVCGTTSMKLAAGFTKLWPSILMWLFYALSLTTLTLALKKIDISVAYAIWSGLGTVLISIIGFSILGETFSMMRGFGIALVVSGVMLLKWSS